MPMARATLEFSSQRFLDVVIASPQGRIDQSSVEAFQQSLMRVLDDIDGHPAALLLDLTGVDYISSVGLRVVMVAARRMKTRPARIAAAGLQPVVREIFEISRFHHVVEVFAGLRDGVQALSPKALEAYDAAARRPGP